MEKMQIREVTIFPQKNEKFEYFTRNDWNQTHLS